MHKMRVRSLGQEDPLEKGMATHSSILAWEIPRMEEPGGLRSMGCQRVGHDWATSLLLFIQNMIPICKPREIMNERFSFLICVLTVWTPVGICNTLYASQFRSVTFQVPSVTHGLWLQCLRGQNSEALFCVCLCVGSLTWSKCGEVPFRARKCHL